MPLDASLPERPSNLGNPSPEAVAGVAGILTAITSAHELSESERERLESAYTSLGQFMIEHPHFGQVTLEVHVQGSLLIGTTTRAEGKAEIDVDLVLSLHPRVEREVSCMELLDSLHDAAADYADQHQLEAVRKRRCVQLQYANQMHADVTPVVYAPGQHGPYAQTLGLVPDRDLTRYLDTNPKGYGSWFAQAAARAPQFLQRRRFEEMAKADVLPLPSVQIFDRLLSRLVQVFKVHRNVVFASRPNVAPTSVFLTTLIAQAYVLVVDRVFSSPIDLLLEIWQWMPRLIERQPDGRGGEHWTVRNPAALADNLADRMNDRIRQEAFHHWHRLFRTDFLQLVELHARRAGIDEVVKFTANKFGERASKGVNAGVNAHVDAQRRAARVNVPARPLMTAAATARAITMTSKPHGFFGR